MPTIDEVLQQGWQLHQAGRVGDAERVYRRVLEQVAEHPAALVYLGIARFDQRDFTGSADAYRAALARQPLFPIAWNNLGNSLRMLGDVEEADRCFARALEQQPGYLSALKNRGTLWVWSGEIERGLQWYEQGLQVAPEHAELHRNLGVIRLLLGDYETGWPEYRWRWRMPGLVRPPCDAPPWRGESLSGRSILLYPEQGRGDTLQFSRLAPLLSRAGAHVIVQCDPVLLPMMSCVREIQSLIPEGMGAGPVDFQASLVEAVDYWYQQNHTLPYGDELFDANGGYLSLPPGLVAYWSHWLSQHTVGRRVGINWQGNPEHHADVYRSIPLESLRPLASLPDTTLVSLQFGTGSEQLEGCSFSDQVVRLPTPLDQSGGAFMDTAAIIRSLDIVITTDTAVAHLAGALGKRVLILLGKVPDWRWGLLGSESDWYPAATLLRQPKLGDWSPVIEQLEQELTG